MLAVVALAVASGAGLAYRRYRQESDGPTLPACSAEPLLRRTFESPIALSGPTDGSFDVEPSLALDPQGRAVVAFMVRSSPLGSGHIAVARISADEHVERGMIAMDRAQAFDPWLATRADGGLVLAWLGHNGGWPEKEMEVVLAESPDGLAWSKPSIAFDIAHDCPGSARGCLDKPMVAIGPGNATYVAYYSEAGEGLKLVRRSGGAWSESSKAAGGAFADLHADSKGALHLVDVEWDAPDVDRFGDARIRLEYARSDDGGKRFSAPLPISRPGEPVPFYFASPRILVDEARGLLHALYPSGSGITHAYQLVLATSADQGQHWTHVRVNDDADGCGAHVMPFAALDPKTGAVHVAWYEDRSGQGGIAYARCNPGARSCTRNEQVSTLFARFGLGRNSPTWLGDYAALALDSERRVLHAAWTQTVLEDGQPHGRVFYARGRLGD